MDKNQLNYFELIFEQSYHMYKQDFYQDHLELHIFLDIQRNGKQN